MSALVFVKLFAIFAVVAIGWAVARSGRLGGGDPSRVLAGAAFYIFVPALLFRTSARTDFARLDVRIVLAFFVPTIVVLLLVYATLRFARAGAAAAPAAPSVRAITASFGNAVQIGIPLAAALYGESGLALHVTLVSLHALILLTILTALVELDLAHARAARRCRRRAISSPRWRRRRATPSSIRSSCRCSPAWPGTSRGSRCPAFADEILATLGQAVVPLCLVLIGVSLAHYGVRGALRGAAVLSFVKLVVQPLAVLAFARVVLGLAGVPLAIVVMMAAVPVGSNALIFAQRYETLPAETSTAIVVSTLAFVVTAPLWLAVLHAIG